MTMMIMMKHNHTPAKGESGSDCDDNGDDGDEEKEERGGGGAWVSMALPWFGAEIFENMINYCAVCLVW